jgi:signal transduction histidine kinase
VAETKVDGASVRLPPQVELALYRIAQEALRNIERHSDASNVTVSLRYGASEVELVVSDDGVGFDLARNWARSGDAKHLGLLGMRERARIVGGEIEIQSRRGAGTTVRATVPVPDDDR